MITCEQMTNRITEYLEGTVPRGERIGMWLHLLICHHCRRYLRQMKRAIAMMGELADTPGAAVDETTKQDLLAQFREHQSSPGDPSP